MYIHVVGFGEIKLLYVCVFTEYVFNFLECNPSQLTLPNSSILYLSV